MIDTNKEELMIINFKAVYPFVYFLIEPNRVLCYKIISDIYVTFLDMSTYNEWETYELNDGEEFEFFNPDNKKQLKGEGCFISQDDLNRMVDIINNCIQTHRRSINLSDMTSVHIVSPEYVAGSLRVGLDNPKTVIGFPDFLSIGPLWNFHVEKGQTLREEWLFDNINYELDDFEYRNKLNITIHQIVDIPSNVPIYLWYGENADEQIGLRFILYALKNKDNDIFLMNSTELYRKFINAEEPILHTGQIDPEILRLLFEQSKKNPPLTQNFRLMLLKEWEALSQTKEVLRAWDNGKVVGLPSDNYDKQIIGTLERLHKEQEKIDFIKVGQVIGNLIEHSDVPINSLFLEYRIRYLIYQGVFELKGIPKSIRHYCVKLRS